jgi:hypothetical protein
MPAAVQLLQLTCLLCEDPDLAGDIRVESASEGMPVEQQRVEEDRTKMNAEPGIMLDVEQMRAEGVLV